MRWKLVPLSCIACGGLQQSVLDSPSAPYPSGVFQWKASSSSAKAAPGLGARQWDVPRG